MLQDRKALSLTSLAAIHLLTCRIFLTTQHSTWTYLEVEWLLTNSDRLKKRLSGQVMRLGDLSKDERQDCGHAG